MSTVVNNLNISQTKNSKRTVKATLYFLLDNKNVNCITNLLYLCNQYGTALPPGKIIAFVGTQT